MDLFSKRKSEQTTDQANDHATSRALTVTQLTQKIKGLLEMEVSEVWIQGEISGFKPAASGHLYFSLKDENALLSCALFKGVAQRYLNSQFQLKDGAEVLIHGKISVYPPRGSYQLIVDHIEPLGSGAFRLAFEKLKAQLEKEGLFSQARKKVLPEIPEKIVVITSPTGAVIRDIITVLNRRNSRTSVLIIPTLVQGDAAPEQIVRAIEIANRFSLGDVLILARGGGSIEDLWAFNNENVVRALAASSIPTISAIGHETDFTLCDFVADVRAPTPSAAAEIVTKHQSELLEVLKSSERRQVLALKSLVQRLRNQTLHIERRLISPQEQLSKFSNILTELRVRLKNSVVGIIPGYRQRVDEFITEISLNLENLRDERSNQLEVLTGQLQALSPLKVLGRGYTLVEDAKTGRLIKSVRNLDSTCELHLVFNDGKAKVKPI